jgi:hypothetical protein
MTPTPDFRALCAEFVEICKHDRTYTQTIKFVARARAALATPPPEPPTDEELYDYWISTSPQFGCADPVGFARAVLERWGHG